MAHDSPPLDGWTPEKPEEFFKYLWWWLNGGWNPMPAPHGNECEHCRDYYNLDDIGIRPVTPWPDPPPIHFDNQGVPHYIKDEPNRP